MADNFYPSIPDPGLWADLILVAHALIVCFVVLGQLMTLPGWLRLPPTRRQPRAQQF